MGEVWQAADTRLDRVVALKFTAPDMLARFEQEARAASALQHPNIVSVHDVGGEGDVHFIVSELVEGETLRAILLRGALPLKRALDIASQIADGLAAAHAQGITHRDIKPENVMVTPEGRAKILDFGLAKRSAKTISPTDSTVSFASEAGTILGTTNYMSPEQARGLPVDFRSDQFSFGSLFHEMLTGSKPFQRDSGPQTLAAVIADEAPPLPSAVPAPVRWVVERCLEKEAGQRYASTADLHRDLKRMREHLSDLSVSGAAVTTPVPLKKRWLLPVAFATGALGMAWLAARQPGSDPLEIYPVLTELESESAPAFSPDGKALAFTRAGTELWVRAVAGGQATQLATRALGRPVWSPDGSRVCFTRRQEFWCVSAAGGAPKLVLEDCGRDAVFTPDGKAIYSLHNTTLLKSEPAGTPLKKVDSVRIPELSIGLHGFSPDGSQLAVRTVSADVWLVPLSGGAPRFLMKAAAFDWLPDGEHAAVVSELESSRALYMTGLGDGASRLLLRGSQRLFDLAVSPDGDRIAYSSGLTDWDPVEFTMDGKRVRNLVTSTMMETSAAWAPDGKKFLYVSYAGREPAIWIRDENGEEPRLLYQAGRVAPSAPAFSGDGKRVAFWEPDSLKTIAAAGGEPVEIAGVREPVTALCWTPDSETIWYATGPRLWKVSSQGGTPEMVREDARFAVVCGDKGVAFPSMGVIRLMSYDGVSTAELAIQGPSTGGIAFGEGGRVLYTLDAPAHELHVWDVAAKKKIRTTRFAVAEGERTNRFAVHPDGKRVIVQAGRLNYDIWMAENFARPAPRWRRWFLHWDVPVPRELPPPPPEQ